MPGNWKHQSLWMRCKTCIFFVPKEAKVPGPGDPFWEKSSIFPGPPTMVEFPVGCGRCQRHAPTTNGFPEVFVNDWCGDYKLDEEKFAGLESPHSSKYEGPFVHIDGGIPVHKALNAIELLADEILEARGFICIYKKSPMILADYCDDCPLSEKMNNWSDVSKLYCRREKHYSK